MYQDQCDAPKASFQIDTCDALGKAPVEFEWLRGTVISGIDFGDDRVLEVKGTDREGQVLWRMRIDGSARFTFSHRSEKACWLVETNFDAAASVRSSERTMMLAMRGAVVSSFRAEQDGLFIRSDDGRGIEMPYALNEDGVIIDCMPHGDRDTPCRIVLPTDLGGS